MATDYEVIQIRRGTTSAWTAANPVPAQGELCFDTTTGAIKIGDGLTHYLSLPYPPLPGLPQYANNAAAIAAGKAVGTLYINPTGNLMVVYTP